MRRFNGRLAALPAYDDFTHFAQPMFSLEKAQGTSNAKKVKIAVNWRCVEYEHLVCQLPYVTPEHKQLTQLFMAWADLYVTLRSVAPTAQSTGTMQNEYAPHASCDGSLLDIIARFVMINVYFLSINAKENAGQCGFFALILVSMQAILASKYLLQVRQIHTIPGSSTVGCCRREGGSGRAKGACCAPHACVCVPVGCN